MVHIQNGNESGDEVVDVDWTTDDEMEILGEAEISSPPALTTHGTELLPGNGKVHIQNGSDYGDEIVDVACTTDDEIEILGEAEIRTPPALTTHGTELLPGNGKVHIQNGSDYGDDIVDVAWTTDDELEILGEAGTSSPPALATHGTELMPGNGEASSSAGVSYSKLATDFVKMGFPQKLVSEVIEENGEGNPDLVLSILLTYADGKDSPQEQASSNPDQSSSDYNENVLDDLSDMDRWSEDEKTGCTDSPSEKHKMLLSLAKMGSLSEKEEKLLSLANMGYTVEEASIAMERCGPEVSISVLTDFICAAQMAREADFYLPEEDVKPKHLYSKNKKRKLSEMSKRKKVMEEENIRLPKPMIGFGVPSQQPERICRFIPNEAKGPPYFYYENVALAPKGVWDKISKFLHDIEPEFVDSKYFSACARKRGYVHNLPIENRFPLIPLPPMTIQQAFPLSRRWWPSWDPRDKMNCIQTAIGSAKLTERIRSALERYHGDPPKHVQDWVLEQCRKWNLVWTGKNKVAPLETDEVEMLLGFPKNHTRGGGISRTDRYKSLGNSFQVDTVAYHLSVLRDIFPTGVNVLSLFSGIGGGEVALHRLGIKLKVVVSVEKSKANRDIVRSWWEQTDQTGHLIDFDDVQQIDEECLRQIISSLGGFDLVIGGSPCNNLAGSNRVSRDGLEGKESSLFYEFPRILGLIRDIMARQV